MLNDFGRFLRKIRIDRGEIIKGMSEKLGVTASYLSAIETGKRKIPVGWTEKIIKLYALNEKQAIELRKAESSSIQNIKFDLSNLLGERRETAILFAREFDGLDDNTLEEIRKIINKDERED